MNRIDHLLDQAVEAYAARDFARAIEVCDIILKQKPEHPRAHSFRALSNLERVVRELRGHFDALSLAAVALRGGSDELPEAERSRHLKTAQRIYKAISSRIEDFLKSLTLALKKDPSLHRDFPPQTAADYRHHWDAGLRKALAAAVDVVTKIDAPQGKKLNSRLATLGRRFEALLDRIETPPDSLPDVGYGELTSDGEMFDGLPDDSGEAFPSFDLSAGSTLSLADDEGKLELMSLAENTEAGQLLITDASGMLVEFDDTAGPIGRLEFPGAPPVEPEPDPEEEKRRLAEMERERQEQLKAMQQMASQAADQAAQRMQQQLEEARKQAEAERERFAASLAEAQKALAAAEQRMAQQAQQEAERRKKDVAEAQRRAAEEARQRLAELERENEAAKRALQEAEQERQKLAQRSPEEIAAQVAERVAMQMIERFQEQMQSSSGPAPAVPSAEEIAELVAMQLGTQLPTGGGSQKSDKQYAKIAASAAKQASREIHEQVTMLTNAGLTSAGATTAAGGTRGPGIPSLTGGITDALGRRRGAASPAGSRTAPVDKLLGAPAARPGAAPPAVAFSHASGGRGGPSLNFLDREDVVPLETPEGKGILQELRAAYRTWVTGLNGHPWPQAADALFPLSLHRGRLYTFQLQVLFEARTLKPGEAEYADEPLPAAVKSARDFDLWRLGVDLPFKPVAQQALYRLPESYERRGNRLSFLELRVERVPRVEMFLFPADSLPPKTNIVEALRGSQVLATEHFEPFLDAAATRRLFPAQLHGLLRSLAADLQRQETASTKLRYLTVVVAEVGFMRLRYRLPGAPDYRRATAKLPAVPGAAEVPEITNHDPDLGRVYECSFFAQPGGTGGTRTWHVAPRADVALEHAMSLHKDAAWSAARGRQDRTMRLTQQLLTLNPSDMQAWALQRKIRRQARFDYRVGFVLGLVAAVAVALTLLKPAPMVAMALAPLYLLAGGLTSFALWHGVGLRIGSRWLRWVLATVLVAGVTLSAPWLLAGAAPYPWLQPAELYPGLAELQAAVTSP